MAAVVRHDIGRKDEGRGEGSGQIVAVGVNCSDPNHIEVNMLCVSMYDCASPNERVVTSIRESVDSLCRDGADMPRPPYIGKACTRPNLEDLSLFRYLTIVYESLCTQ